MPLSAPKRARFASCLTVGLTSLVALVCVAPLAQSAPSGWRHDGTGHYPGGAPTTWSLETSDQVRWRTPLPAWANSSPVVIGERVFVTTEPATLHALSTKDGRMLWQDSLEVIDALKGAEAKEARALIASAKIAEKRLKTLQRRQRTLSRKLRKPGAPEAREALQGELAELEAEQSTLRTTLDGAERFWVRPRGDTIGYASATPVADRERVYVLYGSGIVAAYSHSGERVWVRWLGPPHRPMRGNTHGHAASPLLIGGQLIVALGTLQALNPETGGVVWRGGVYDDFGTPAAVTIGGTPAVATPRGLVHRASDGKLLADVDANTVYIGPVEDERFVYWVGSTVVADATASKDYGTWAMAVSKRALSRGDATPTWRVRVGTEAVYATPALHNGLLYIVDRSGRLTLLKTQDGALSGPYDLPTGMASASPIIAGEFLYVVGEDGRAVIGRAGRPFTFHANVQTEGGRATPTVHEGHLYLRSDQSLISLGAP
ncbi:MAG: PQQ-binding-like beta-propeller repeat protein [Myxococcota bacterium]